MQEPNLGKTNPRVSLLIRSRFVLHPLSRGLDYISNANPACSCDYFENFSFALFTPPLGDFHSLRAGEEGVVAREGRSQTAAREACNRPAVTSTPPPSPKPTVVKVA